MPIRYLGLGCILLGALVQAQPLAAAQRSTSPSAAQSRDGQHDWDTFFGSWKMCLRRHLHPLTGSDDWVQFGTNLVHGEQAYSIDGGRTWEANWIEDLTREEERP